jgi:hypothetical protein
MLAGSVVECYGRRAYVEQFITVGEERDAEKLGSETSD